MNSKTMGSWAGIFLLISFAIIIYQLISDKYQPEIFYFLIVSAVFNVGSAIMKKLESFGEE
jgi:hypothetical protein